MGLRIPRGAWSLVTFPRAGALVSVLPETFHKQAMPKSAQLSILYAEDDLELLASQAAHIQKAGHTVDQVTGRKAVEESVRRKAYDLVILGDTLNKNDRHHLPYMVKKANQATKVLVLHSTHGHPSVDKEIDSPYSQEKLIEAITSFAPQKAMAAGAGR